MKILKYILHTRPIRGSVVMVIYFTIIPKNLFKNKNNYYRVFFHI